MTVRILIERTVEADRQGELVELMKQLRAKAIHKDLLLNMSPFHRAVKCLRPLTLFSPV